jgi:CTP synthase
MKYVIVTGGVMSGIGKGITTSSMAMIFSRMGYRVTVVKIDPYINVDAGTMNPYMHGEIFVTEDGGEADLDLGHYERFLDVNLKKYNNITTGKVYSRVIDRERRGEYLGQTVQIIPHVTDEIKSMIKSVGKDSSSDIVFVEIGGTVGDIESLPFLEAARQMQVDEGINSVAYVHVAYLPVLTVTGEQKTKPVQHSVQELRRIGIQPDMIVGRSSLPLSSDAKRKISLYTSVPLEGVISNHDAESIYEVPLILEEQGVSKYLTTRLGLGYKSPRLSDWINFVKKVKESTRTMKLSLVGKYTSLRDSYLSIREAIVHAAASLSVKPVFNWVEATDIEKGKIDVEEALAGSNGGLILPGFGARGAEGKIKAIRWFREEGIPLLGICFGMQLMVVEYARNVLGLEKANTTEIDPSTPHPVITLLEEQREVRYLGGTMRLGAYAIKLKEGTLVHKLYGRTIVYERHRHRYEVNPEYIDEFEKHGLKVSGISLEGERVEFLEMKDHPFYLATQSHPEYKSRPLRPSPPYLGLVKAALQSKD